MVNPFSNQYEEYKNYILQGEIPKSDDSTLSLLDCFEVLHTNNGYDSDLIKKMFEVYMKTITFDEALTVFYSNSVAHARDIAVIEFANTCCRSSCKINNVDVCMECFERIYPKILWKLLLNYKAYLCHLDLHLYEGVEESVFNNSSFNESINVYVNKVCSTLNYTLNASDPIDKLKEILDMVKKEYSSKGYPVGADDFINLLKHSTTAVHRIEALHRIEQFIISHNNSSSMQNSLMDDINEIRNIIQTQKSNNEQFLNYSGFELFLSKVASNGLSSDERVEYESMIKELSAIDLSYSVRARRLLMELDSKINSSDQS